jgi:aminomethyltransferase
MKPLGKASRWGEWAGYLAPTMYALDHLHEYHALRTSCALFDVSPLFKYDIRGPGALDLLNRVVVRDVARCRVGQVLYTVWCDDDGKVIDDGTVSRLSEGFFRMTSSLPSLHWLQDNAVGLDATIEDVSEEFAGLALQGPTSRDLLQRLMGEDLSGLRFFRCMQGEVASAPALISRTGYTGDLGYEVFVSPEDAGHLWDSIVGIGDAYKLRPAGTVALELARIEAGLLLLDADFISAAQTEFEVQKTSPYDLGLAWMVDLEKDFFVGQESLRREKAHGSRWNTVGLELDTTSLEKFYAEYGMPLHLPQQGWTDAVPCYADEAQRHHIGRGTSGMWSPTLKKYIVMARLDPQHATRGTRIFIEEMIEAISYSVPARVVDMPFFDPPRKKQ